MPSPDPSSGEDSDNDQGGSGGASHHHCPQLVEEVLVSPSPPDGMQDLSPAPMQEESPVTMPDQQGWPLSHRPDDPQVDGMEAEWCAFQD